jgi:hypothetical protein
VSGLAQAREVLDHLLEEYGELTPAMVVEAARPEDSPIHGHFEWDDDVAAEAHRRDQARRLIRKVKVVYGVDEEGREKTVRAFVSARQEPKGPRAYRPTEEVLQNPIARQLLLREFERDWLQFRARYEHLAEFWQVIRPDGESEAV